MPLAPDVTVIQSSLLLAVHAQPLPVETATVPGESFAATAEPEAIDFLGGADSPRIGLWIVVVFATLIAGAFAAYYLISL